MIELALTRVYQIVLGGLPQTHGLVVTAKTTRLLRVIP